MALYLGATAQNVEDIIQDFYIKIIEINSADGNLNRITGENGKLHTMYVFKIIQSNVVNDFRAKKKDIFEENYTNENETKQNILSQSHLKGISCQIFYDKLISRRNNIKNINN